MSILDLPFLIEILFAISLLVFLGTLYVVLPAFIHEKRTLFKPKLINSLWLKSFKRIKEELKTRLGIPQKKNVKQLLYITQDRIKSRLEK